MHVHVYHNNPKYLDKQVWANIVDPDQMMPQGVHFLSLIQQFLYSTSGIKKDLFNF